MRRALIALSVLSLLTALLVAGPVSAQSQAQRGLRVFEDGATDAPTFVTGLDEPARRGPRTELALSHLGSNRSLYEIDSPASNLEVVAVHRAEESSTVRFQQLHDGVPVFGAHYLVHFEQRGSGRAVTAVNGNYFTDLDANVEAQLSENTARTLAVARLRGVEVDAVQSNGLVVLPDGGGVTAFHFTLWGRGRKGPVKQQTFISARTGAPVLSYNDLQGIDPVGGSGVRIGGDTVDLSLSQEGLDAPYDMRGFLDPNEDPPPDPPDPPDPPPEPLPLVEFETHDAEGRDGFLFETSQESLITNAEAHFDGRFTDIGAVDAHWGTERVFEFYKSLGRNSIDGEGGKIISIVNAGDAGNRPMYNAYWDGRRMVYGNPEPNPATRKVNPLSADLDIVAHELTHGVIEHSAGFVYLNQSGAMSEAYSDYFGNAVDVNVSGTSMDDDEAGWIAEDICVDGETPDPGTWDCPFLRDLNDGTGVEDFGFYLVDYDNGGVHLNSTVFSGALWDIREDLEPEVADELMYLALTQFGTPLQSFFEGRVAVITASNLMGLSDEQRAVIKEAFDARGIVEGWDDSPDESDAKLLLQDIAPLGIYNAAPEVSGSRYVVGTYEDKERMFEEAQAILVGNVSGTGGVTRVNTGTGGVLYDELPDISGQQVVWARGDEVGPGEVTFDVVAKKLGGGMRTIAATPTFEWFPAIDGNLVAWESWDGAQTDIWARRIGKLPKRLTNSRRDEFYPQVAGNKIAWINGAANQIVIKNFKTGAKTTIRHSNAKAYFGPPALNDTHVFWFQDDNNDGWGAIVRANHRGKKKKTLVEASDRDVAPFYDGLTPEPPRISVNDKFLVYGDEFGYAHSSEAQHVGRDVWHLPVKGGTPKVVTCNRGDQAYASIGNRKRAVWLDGSLGRTDLMTRAQPRTLCRPGDLTRG